MIQEGSLCAQRFNTAPAIIISEGIWTLSIRLILLLSLHREGFLFCSETEIILMTTMQ